MKLAQILFAALLLCQIAGAEKIELAVGKEISPEVYAQLRKLNLEGVAGDIINRRPKPSVFIDKTEFVSEDGKFVVAIEVTRDPLNEDGKSLLTKVYFSNIGERASGAEDGTWKWVKAKKVVVDTTKWRGARRGMRRGIELLMDSFRHSTFKARSGASPSTSISASTFELWVTRRLHLNTIVTFGIELAKSPMIEPVTMNSSTWRIRFLLRNDSEN